MIFKFLIFNFTFWWNFASTKRQFHSHAHKFIVFFILLLIPFFFHIKTSFFFQDSRIVFIFLLHCALFPCGCQHWCFVSTTCTLLFNVNSFLKTCCYCFLTSHCISPPTKPLQPFQLLYTLMFYILNILFLIYILTFQHLVFYLHFTLLQIYVFRIFCYFLFAMFLFCKFCCFVFQAFIVLFTSLNFWNLL